MMTQDDLQTEVGKALNISGLGVSIERTPRGVVVELDMDVLDDATARQLQNDLDQAGFVYQPRDVAAARREAERDNKAAFTVTDRR